MGFSQCFSFLLVVPGRDVWGRWGGEAAGVGRESPSGRRYRIDIWKTRRKQVEVQWAKWSLGRQRSSETVHRRQAHWVKMAEPSYPPPHPVLGWELPAQRWRPQEETWGTLDTLRGFSLGES